MTKDTKEPTPMHAEPTAADYGWPSRPKRQDAAPRFKAFLAHALALFMSAVFLDSLRFKFTNAPKTQIIFGDLDRWAEDFGAAGLFAPTGLFSQYAIGAAELAASLLLLLGVFAARRRFLQPVGALLGVAVMTGAISFHLFTPLGVNVAGDGGALFYTACATFVCGVVLLILRAPEIRTLLRRLAAFLARE